VASRRLAAYVITLNEERHIAEAVASLMAVSDHVLVVDSCSTDATVEAARRAGAEVRVRPFESFAEQRTFALECLIEDFDPAWVLTIDADERLSRRLVDEIHAEVLVPDDDRRYDAYVMPRVVSFEGRTLRFGGVSRTRLLRLYRPNAGRYERRTVNEHFALAPGRRLGTLTSPIEHHDVTSWERHIAKHNRYSTLEAEERAAALAGNRERVSAMQALVSPYFRRRWLREQAWNRLPGKPFLRFVQMFVLSGGFLDGGPGFDIALFQAWQEMCTEQKFKELAQRAGVPRSSI
jgi:glycosyltransferase involved in cell wall biosynthesis